MIADEVADEPGQAPADQHADPGADAPLQPEHGGGVGADVITLLF